MNYILIIPLFLLLIILIIYIILLNKQFKSLKENKIEEFTVDTIKKCEEIKKQKEREVENSTKILNNQLKGLQTLLSEKEKRYEEVNQDLDLYRSGKIKEIDKAAAEYKEHQQLLVDNGIKEYRELTNDFFNAELWNQKEQISQINEQKASLLKDIETIKEILEEERSKRAAINEQIRKQRELEEQQDFYRIQLDPKDLNDIKILRDIAPRLRHPEAINKVVWSGYYQKPLAELRKRLLPNGDISGIYKITRMKTKEIYIGQSTSIDKRWQEHVKTALGVGNLASSQFHRAMAKDGPENFFFEVLEETKKDKLREREAYYIQWFRSDKFGLNSNSGDKNK